LTVAGELGGLAVDQAFLVGTTAYVVIPSVMDAVSWE
jgi:hypothetical protein